MSTSYLAYRSEAQATARQYKEIPEIVDSLDSLKDGLSFLLDRYFKHQNKTVATKIVKQLEMILRHHDASDFPADRCSFYRLIRYWRAKCI